ncbi:MAG: YfhO family protein [Coriobacteriales bacterium]|jgi:uncharacterized membrane protein YfhO|nr:YfhO family protein [Coriobacteriales bacterium]
MKSTNPDATGRSVITGRPLAFLCYALVFVIPITILLFSFYELGLYPFGDKDLVVWDLEISYINNYEWLTNCLAGTDSLFYSFSKSLGGNMLASWASILVSPLNLLKPFFGSNPVDFITFMIVLKFGLAGLTALFYVRHRFRVHPGISLALSIGYALMSFMTYQSANPMWMDAVVLLPLVLYGVYCLVRQGKVLLFSLSLLAVILINYYNGYMLCLFSVLFYILESFLAVPEARAGNLTGPGRLRLGLLINPGRFSVVFTLTVLMSMVILAPVALQINGGRGVVPSGFFNLGVRYELPDVFRALFLGVQEGGYLPQIYTGMLATLGLFWLFFNEWVPTREKAAVAIILGIMLASTWLVMGDRIWLGFRDGNSFYCRFAFLVSALVVFCAARSFEAADSGLGKKGRFVAVAIVTVLATLAIYLDGHILAKPYLFATIVVCLLLALLLGLLGRARSAVVRAVLCLFLICTVSAEAYLSWYQIVSTRNADTYNTTGDYYRAGHETIARIEAMDTDTADAYRLEKTFHLMGSHGARNESLALDYKGIMQYDSLYDSSVQTFLKNCGYTYGVSAINSYNMPLLTSDSLLALRYVLSEKQPFGYVSTSIDSAWQDTFVFENPYALPLGFLASKEALALIDIDNDYSATQPDATYPTNEEPEPVKDDSNRRSTAFAFDFQNQLFAALLGDTETSPTNELYSAYTHVSQPMVISEPRDEISWTLGPAAATDIVTADDRGGDYLFGYISYDGDLPWSGTSELFIDGELIKAPFMDVWGAGVFPIGAEVDGGHVVSIRDIGDFDADKFTLTAAKLNRERFSTAIDILRAKPLELDSIGGDYVHGYVTASGQSDEILFTTLVYDPGWTIKVNGQAVEPLIAQDTFIALALPAGNNEIEMNYLPPGLISGAAISTAAVVLFVLFVVIIRRRDRVVLIQRSEAAWNAQVDDFENADSTS